MDRPLCIYHGNCADGFGAAWVFNNHFSGECDFHAGVYQSAMPDVVNRDVYLVDFSYKRAAVEAMVHIARSVTLIDHHKTALEDLQGLMDIGAIKHYCDLEKSGATLAWEFLHNGRRDGMPKLLAHIEDRDLWRFKLERTREIQANVFSYPYDFKVWDELMRTDPEKLAIEGTAIERKHFKDIDELIKVTARRIEIGGHLVPVANLPYTLTSDVGNILSFGEPFAACYWDTPDGRVFSLRSNDGGIDVSEIAKLYGGGGHPKASGFKVKYDHPLANPEFKPL